MKLNQDQIKYIESLNITDWTNIFQALEVAKLTTFLIKDYARKWHLDYYGADIEYLSSLSKISAVVSSKVLNGQIPTQSDYANAKIINKLEEELLGK